MARVGPSRNADTSVEAEAVQASGFRALSIGRRLRIAFGLSASVITLARRAIRRAAPSASQTAQNLRFVRLHYGEQLGAELEIELRRREVGGQQAE
jgi:hypothetical protein